MQSIAVYSRNASTTTKSTSKLAINLLKSILSQYTNKTNFLHEKTNNILNTLKYLINQSISSNQALRHYSISNGNHLVTHHTPNSLKIPFFLFGNSILSNLFTTTCIDIPLLALDQEHKQEYILNNNKLHLITAYSGYSKDYLNYHFKTNIKTTCFSLNNNNSNEIKATTTKMNSLRCNKKGVIGDDAWFIARQKYVDVLGVADGVGGWRDMGIDPSRFSFNLMKTCKRLVEQEYDLIINNKTPIYLLEQSYRTLLESKNNSLLIGSSTACILLFHHETNLLHTCNLGDSGFCIIRNNKIIHRSQEQQHYFNSPYQIAILPNLNLPNNSVDITNNSQAEYNYNNNVNNNNNNNDDNNDSLFNDSPQSAISNSIELNEGDFILVATDGLWDNLTESQLLVEISKIKSFLIDDLQKAANNLARKAIELALDPDYISPFAKAARKHGINISGGKPDDITVLLARVSK